MVPITAVLKSNMIDIASTIIFVEAVLLRLFMKFILIRTYLLYLLVSKTFFTTVLYPLRKEPYLSRFSTVIVPDV